MKMITIYAKESKAKYITPISKIMFLEENNGFYYIHLPSMYIGVGKNQFNTIREILEETEL